MIHPTSENTRFTRLRLHAGSVETEVIIGRDILAQAEKLLEIYRSAQIVLVTDQHIAPLYALPLCRFLAQKGYRPHLLEIAAGEDAKTIETLSHLYKACQDLHIERGDIVVTIGGGTVGDVGGMLAGTYLRGLDLVQIPTSLVGMITASIGGKAGINFRDAKNVVGVFKFPRFVFIDLKFLDTLSDVEFRSGLGELITVGVLGAPTIFEALEANGAADLEPLIVDAIQCKASIVEADPFDQLGIRAQLNLGHTFGHALETLSDFSIPHGLAVAVGLHIASQLAFAIGLCPESLPQRICHTLQALCLPTTLTGYHPTDVLQAMQHDKKRSRGQLQYVLPIALGKVALVSEDQIPHHKLEEVLRKTIWTDERNKDDRKI